MSENNIVTFYNSSITSTEDLTAHLIAGRESKPPVASNVMPFLRLDHDGNWIYGRENTDVEDGSLWAIDPMSLTVGWINWADPKMNGGKREKCGEVMGPCTQVPAMPVADHSDKGGEWVKQYGFDLVCVYGQDEGQHVAYRTSSRGGTKAYSAVYDEILARPHPDYFFPIVSLEHSSYNNPNYGGNRVNEPEFKVTDWSNKENQFLSNTGESAPTNDNAPQISEAAETAPENVVNVKPRKTRRAS